MESDTRDRVAQNLTTYLTWKKRPRIRPTLERGILASHWDDLARFLCERGYTWYTVRRVIEISKPFAAYAEGLGARDVTALTDGVFRSFSEARPRRENRRCLRLLRLFLTDRGLITDPDPPPLSPESGHTVLDEYLAFLQDHRGIGQSTARNHRHHVTALLDELDRSNAAAEDRSLTGPDIQRFVASRAAVLSRDERKRLCAAIRAFLRFLYLRGYTSIDLATAVPVIPSFKQERLPTAVSKDAIERILAAVDRSTAIGRRDYAMLLLLATYGLRAGQLCALRLDDIDWRQELLRIPGSKGGQDHVYPLHPAVGEAIVDYLRNGRPAGWGFREIFLSVRAPIGPLRGCLTNQIKPNAHKAGIQLSCLGAHAWRHACATRMLETGQSLKTIRHVLGHRSIETTFIYTKVDLSALRHATLEWPEVRP